MLKAKHVLVEHLGRDKTAHHTAFASVRTKKTVEFGHTLLWRIEGNVEQFFLIPEI